MSNKKKTTNVPALKNQFTQADVPSMLEKVNQAISNLKGDKEEAVKISEALGNFGIIHNINDPAILIHAYNYITHKAKSYKEIMPVFENACPNIKVPEFKESGHSVTKWQEEIVRQYKVATYKEELEKLEQIKKELEDCLSTDDKLKAKLSNIAHILEK